MKFSQYTLNQVAGFDGQILAQQLVYNQKDFWNLQWSSQTGSSNGWNYNTIPVDLTGATISAEIVRRAITEFKDSRSGLDFQIHDYPLIPLIATVTQTIAATSQLVCDSISNFYVNQPITFANHAVGGVSLNTTYYVKSINNYNLPYSITISATQGGSTQAVTDDAGLMDARRVSPTSVTLPIINRVDVQGLFTMTIDDNTWAIIAGDPDLDINAAEPACFTGRIKISFPANGTFPTYDEVIFLLFLITSDGVTN